MTTIPPNFPSHVWNSFFEQSIGFEKLLNKIELSHNGRRDNNSYPPFNIVKKTDSSYEISIAVAGFIADNIEVKHQDNILTIMGEIKAEDENSYVVKGIASRKFNKSFSLNEYAVVDKVALKNGILTIILNIVLPEEKQPQIFKIEE